MLTRKPIRMLLRRAERSCCACVTCMPLAAVYSLTTYTVWVEMSLGFRPTKSSWVGM
ncbi:hypothetical protein KEM55_005117 [Ascosphaera atra]|nr:hypothetical protein KEM55_005117 [Ascosphaera atra]